MAENGALVSHPASGNTTLLGESPPESLILALQQRQVEPLSIGQGIKFFGNSTAAFPKRQDIYYARRIFNTERGARRTLHLMVSFPKS